MIEFKTKKCANRGEFMGDTVLDKDVSITRDDHKNVKKLFKKYQK